MLERLGIPTVTICTDVFASLAASVASAKGVPDLKVVTIPHPLAGRDVSWIQEQAQAIYPEILTRLAPDA